MHINWMIFDLSLTSYLKATKVKEETPDSICLPHGSLVCLSTRLNYGLGALRKDGKIGSIFKEQLSHGSVLAVCGAAKPCYYIEIVLTFIYVGVGFFFFFFLQKPSNSYSLLVPFSVCLSPCFSHTF